MNTPNKAIATQPEYNNSYDMIAVAALESPLQDETERATKE